MNYRRRAGFNGGVKSHLPHATMIVEDDRGFTVLGTMPRNIERALIPLLYEHRDECANLAELLQHSNLVRVEFVAEVERSSDEQRPWFGVFRRPSEARLL
jgi:hypothetical protein